MDKNINNTVESEEEYEDLTEEQLDELNRLSSNQPNPFGAPSSSNKPLSFAEMIALQQSNNNVTEEQQNSATASEENGEDEQDEEDDDEGEIDQELTDQMKTLALTTQKNTATHLVIDTNALISGVRLETLALELYTIPEVLEEVTDKRTQDFLNSFPFEIKTREPTQESIKAVIEFSKITGDYPSLSAVDLKLIALTHTLDVEVTGGKHIKSKPEPTSHMQKKPVNTVKKEVDQEKVEKEQPVSSEKVEEKITESTTTTQQPTEITTTPTSTEKEEEKDTEKKRRRRTRKKSNNNNKNETTTKEEEEKSECQNDHHTTTPTTTTSPETTNNTPADSTKTTSSKRNKKNNLLKVDLNSLEEDKDYVDPREVLEKYKKQQEEELEEKRKKMMEKDGDEGEWITPDNIKKMASNGSNMKEDAVPKHVPVGCITKDFSMQNVILRMGLNLISVDGLLVKEVKQFVLKCYSCLKTTTNMETIFCKHCGHKTLVKAMTWVDRFGNVRVGRGSGKQFNLRGKQFSIPKPKGGKKHNDIILTEDQYIHRLRVTGQLYKKPSKETSVNDPTSFELGFNVRPVENIIIGYGNRNPNIARKKIGKKNKSYAVQ
eukprot:gene5715-7110_t